MQSSPLADPPARWWSEVSYNPALTPIGWTKQRADLYPGLGVALARVEVVNGVSATSTVEEVSARPAGQ